jgi:hypothetical protein
MKKLVITIGLLAGATAAYSQGVINWSDYDTQPSKWFITVWGPQSTGAAPVNNLGNTSTDAPAGTAKVGAGGYTGTALSGTGNEIGLYVDTSAAAVANDVKTGAPIATDTFAAGSGGWDFSGNLNATVPGIASGTSVFVELAAWSLTKPATSYAAALTAGDLVGTSVVSGGTTALGGGGSPPATPGNLAGSGITDFTIGTVGGVPEPSTIALGVMGASAFLMRLRRKENKLVNRNQR